MEQTIGPVCEEAIKAIKDYFIARQLEEAKDQLEEWKEEDIYQPVKNILTFWKWDNHKHGTTIIAKFV